MRLLFCIFVLFMFLYFLSIVLAFNSNEDSGFKNIIQKRNQQIQELINF